MRGLSPLAARLTLPFPLPRPFFMQFAEAGVSRAYKHLTTTTAPAAAAVQPPGTTSDAGQRRGGGGHEEAMSRNELARLSYNLQLGDGPEAGGMEEEAGWSQQGENRCAACLRCGLGGWAGGKMDACARHAGASRSHAWLVGVAQLLSTCQQHSQLMQCLLARYPHDRPVVHWLAQTGGASASWRRWLRERQAQRE